eukprot:COSAG01_NODE_16848_length_1199_cov_2.407273_1_plen_67_part_00
MYEYGAPYEYRRLCSMWPCYGGVQAQQYVLVDTHAVRTYVVRLYVQSAYRTAKTPTRTVPRYDCVP